jgi:hypothetical protein
VDIEIKTAADRCESDTEAKSHRLQLSLSQCARKPKTKVIPLGVNVQKMPKGGPQHL